MLQPLRHERQKLIVGSKQTDSEFARSLVKQISYPAFVVTVETERTTPQSGTSQPFNIERTMQREVAETGVSKQYSDPTVAVSTVLPGQLDHVSHWFVLIFSALRDTSLLGSMLPKHPTGAALSNIKLAADMIDADTTTSGAQGLRPFRFETV